MTAAVVASGLHRFFHAGDEETQALRDVSLTLERGEFVAVVGPSGSGKSTLLACLAGLDEPDGGSVQVDGTRISRRPEAVRAALRSRTIGTLNQGGNLVEHLSVRDNVAVVRRLAGNRGGRPDLLEDLGIATRAHARAGELSGGEAVRAGLAVALANDPAVLLADEPTGELDEVTEAQVLALIRARVDAGTALLVASHSASVAAEADRVLTMTNGRLSR